MPDLVAAHLPRKARKRGFTEGQCLETLLLLQTAGGDGPEDIKLLAGDPCPERGLGFALPKASALRAFLNRFHDEELAARRPAREAQKSFILPSSQPVQGLQQVQVGVVQTGVAGLQPGQRHQGIVLRPGGTDGAVQEISVVAGASGRLHESLSTRTPK